MKTLTISEAIRDLGKVLRQALAGEEIGIRSDDRVVVLCPLPSKEAQAGLSPREALRRLQQATRLSPIQAESYLQEVRAERLASEKRSA